MSWEPKFSQQLNKERTCGLHVIAMITHLPYEYIKTVLPKYNGTNHEDLCRTLYMLGYDADFTWTKFSGHNLPDLCILHIRNHWCIWFKGMIYCSNLGIVTLERYRARIKHFITVKIPTK